MIEKINRLELMLSELTAALPELIRLARIGYDTEILDAEIEVAYDTTEPN
ncbi:hypothetical protein CCP3SC1AL1_760017 [Gammaproteobacteria bacterium]